MSFGFLAPWFFLGALAVGVPLIAHLRRLSVRDRVRFSAMEFLSPMPPKRSQKRWEDVALMALRMGVIGLVALAFARPFLHSAGSEEGGVLGRSRRGVVVLDLSASMRRPGFFEEARKGVVRWVAQKGVEAELEVLGFGAGVRSLVSAEEWRNTPQSERLGLLRARLEAVEPGWERTRMDLGLRAAAEVALQHRADRTEAVVVSDFGEGSVLTGLQGQPWPEGFHVQALPIGGEGVRGGEVHLEWVAPDAERSSGEEPVRVRVVASERFSGERVSLQRTGTASGQWRVPVQAGRGRTVAVPGLVEGGAYVGVGSGEPSLDGVWVARGGTLPEWIVVGGAGASRDPKWDRTFMMRAAEALGPSRTRVVEMENWQAEGGRVGPALWLWSEWPEGEWSGRIRASVESGATAMVTLSSGRGVDRLSAELGGALEAKGAPLEGALILGEIDRQHPVFSPFRTGPFSDLSGIRFWRHFPMRLGGAAGAGGARVLASFEGGMPAVVEVPVGRGRYVVWASGWKPSEGQWVLSSRCVPFLSAMLDWAVGGRVAVKQAFAGERVEVAAGTQRLRREDGRVLELDGLEVRVAEPGVYRIEPDGGTLVVNVAPEEKRGGVLELEKLRALGVPLDEAVAGQIGSGGDGGKGVVDRGWEEVELRQGGWRKVLWGVVGLAALETFLAGRVSRRKGGSEA